MRDDGCRVVGGGEGVLQLAAARRKLRRRRAFDRAARRRLSEHGDEAADDEMGADAFGIKETTWVEGVSKPRISHFVFPSHMRHSAARIGEHPRQVIRFRVPKDDYTTKTF